MRHGTGIPYPDGPGGYTDPFLWLHGVSHDGLLCDGVWYVRLLNNSDRNVCGSLDPNVISDRLPHFDSPV